MSKVNWCALQILVETQIEYRLYFLFLFPSENLSEFKKKKNFIHHNSRPIL